MRAKLICRSGEMAGLEFEIGREATLGRRSANDIVLPAKPISGHHAEIRFDDETGAYYLEDLGSTNGTELDGMEVSGRERLGWLHVITFAKEFDFAFRVLDFEPEAAVQEPSEGALPDESQPADAAVPEGTVIDAEIPTLPLTLRTEGAMSSDGVDGTRIEQIPVVLPPSLAGPTAQGFAPVCALRVLRPKALKRIYPLDVGEHLVGRSSNAQVQIDSADLSRSHARIKVTADGVRLEDLGSRNSTLLDGRPLEGEADCPIGSEVRFASVEAQLIGMEGVELRELEGE